MLKFIGAVVLTAFVLFETIGSPVPYMATAYALQGRTASGHKVGRGIVAADTRLLPLGTQIKIEAGSYSGVYTVRDRGGHIKGRKLDIWVPSVREAKRFGRRKVHVTVVGS